MIFPVFLGLFILFPSLQISDGNHLYQSYLKIQGFIEEKRPEKSNEISIKQKTLPLIFFSFFHRKTSLFFLKKDNRILRSNEKFYSLWTFIGYQNQIKKIWQQNQILDSSPRFSINQEKTIKNPNDSTKRINFLEKFVQTKNSLEIHNKALSFLKNNQRGQAFLLLKRNVYQNFFIPSYFVLFHFEVPIFFAPFLWHICLICVVFTCLFLLILSFKEPSSFNLKLFFVFLSLGFAFSFSGLWILKNRVSSFQEMDLRSSPFSEAPAQASLNPHSDLVVLKQTGDWLLVRSKDKQTGWLKKEEVFQIF